MEEQYLFPFFDDEIEEFIEDDEIVIDEIYKDVAWDYDKNLPIVQDGDFLIVEGLEAVKSWAYRALQTQRTKYEIFTWDYGADVESYIGKVNDTKAKIDLTKEIKDCLFQNKHITNVLNFNFVADKAKVKISFRIITEYGDLDEGVVIDG